MPDSTGCRRHPEQRVQGALAPGVHRDLAAARPPDGYLGLVHEHSGHVSETDPPGDQSHPQHQHARGRVNHHGRTEQSHAQAPHAKHDGHRYSEPRRQEHDRNDYPGRRADECLDPQDDRAPPPLYVRYGRILF